MCLCVCLYIIYIYILYVFLCWDRQTVNTLNTLNTPCYSHLLYNFHVPRYTRFIILIPHRPKARAKIVSKISV